MKKAPLGLFFCPNDFSSKFAVSRPAMKFTKKEAKPSELLKKVKARGLQGVHSQEEETFFYQALQKIGYYRLTGYFLHFQKKNNGLDPNQFQPGTTFRQVLDLYQFDVELRDLALAALGKIEVALRTSICELMCQKQGPHWYQEKSSFILDKLEGVYKDAAKHLEYDLKAQRPYNQQPIPNTKAGHLFIQHYYGKYTDPRTPPSWMLREVASFGFWARTFDALDTRYKKSISDSWKFPNGKRIHYALLSNWFWSLSVLRNRCAHHARITSRSFPFEPHVPEDNPARDGFEQKTDDLRTLFVVVLLLLPNAAPGDMWKRKLIHLLESFPNVDIKKAAGFSKPTTGWEDLPLFNMK